MLRRNLRILILMLAVIPIAALAEDRYALVIGNSKYTNIDPLKNPANDVKLISKSLREVRFEVTLLQDADMPTMQDAVDGFVRKLDDAGEEAVGVFYFAGHGVSHAGENWLIPVGARIRSGTDVKYSTLAANYVLERMETARNKTDILILDACRDNPFPSRGINLGDTRSVSRGMARMDPKGSYIAYSTSLGAVAYDGQGQYSPFAEAFAAEVGSPGISIGDMMISVRSRVQDATDGRGPAKQVPWSSTSMAGRFDFNPAAPAPPVQTNAPAVTAATLRAEPQPAKSPEEMLWDRVQAAHTIDDYDYYIDEFPKGQFLSVAKYERKKLKKQKKARKEAAAAESGKSGGNNPFMNVLESLAGGVAESGQRQVSEALGTENVFPPVSTAPQNVYEQQPAQTAQNVYQQQPGPTPQYSQQRSVQQQAGQPAIWYDDQFIQWQVSVNGIQFVATTLYPGLGQLTLNGQIQGTVVTYGIYDASGQQIGYGQGTLSDQTHIAGTSLWMNGQVMASGRFHFNHAPH